MNQDLDADVTEVVDPTYQWLYKLGYGELVCVFTRLRIPNFYLKKMLKERDLADDDNSGTVSGSNSSLSLALECKCKCNKAYFII